VLTRDSWERLWWWLLYCRLTLEVQWICSGKRKSGSEDHGSNVLMMRMISGGDCMIMIMHVVVMMVVRW